MSRLMEQCYDLAVIGGGSGGIGAAVAGARAGLSVVLVERAETLGGNAVRAGVSNWEPGVGGTGIPFEIYKRLKRIPDAVGVYTVARHCSRVEPGEPPFPGGEHVIDPSMRYLDSMPRFGLGSHSWYEYALKHWHGVVFEPPPYVRVVEGMLAETDRCEVLTGAAFVDVDTDAGRIAAVRLADGRRIAAETFIDCTGDGLVAEACGCRMMQGQESRAAFDEPDAPEKATDRINAVTLIYRVRRTDRVSIEPPPADVPAECWWREEFPVAFVVQYPCGDYCINMLPTMEGREMVRMGCEAAYVEARRRVLAHWHHGQTIFPEFQGFRLLWIAPELGVREFRRTVGRYVLTEHDLLAGLSGQRHEDIIAIADHPMDVHGEGGGCRELDEPYGIPYRCLIAAGPTNLLVASRGGSFSSIAASSCRLSRTIMQLGQAVGTAAALAKRLDVSLPDVPAETLRESLRSQHVQLDWPIAPELREYLANENAT